MSPAFAKLNYTYCFIMNIIFFCYNFLGSFVLAYSNNVYIFKFRSFVFSTTSCFKIASSFFFAIHNVIYVCSEKKMLWINARWVIAFMQYMKLIFNGTTKNKIRGSMRLNYFFFKEKRTISLFGFCAIPQPTGFCFLNLIQKSIFITKLWPSKHEATNSACGVF